MTPRDAAWQAIHKEQERIAEQSVYWDKRSAFTQRLLAITPETLREHQLTEVRGTIYEALFDLILADLGEVPDAKDRSRVFADTYSRFIVDCAVKAAEVARSKPA